MDIHSVDPDATRFYGEVLRTLSDAGIPFLVGGAYAFSWYTEIGRRTKDLDLFLAAPDLSPALDVLDAAGFTTERTHPHWLAKILRDGDSIDLIFASGNGVTFVDDSWFDHAIATQVLGVDVLLCPPEEMLMTKAFVMERERFDGADVAHILRDCAARIDWERLFNLFGPHWRVLYSHLILFGYIYPSRRDSIPGWLLADLAGRLRDENSQPPPDEEICRGTLLSRAQYLTDVEDEGYIDARKWPAGTLTGREIERWTRAIEQDGEPASREKLRQS